jgi:predicted GH43/DUF377 family glycosyl hydrolase
VSVFNPGAIDFKGKIILLYRAVGDDHISRLGYAESSDGIHFTRMSDPVYDPPINDSIERLGAEDPRITKLGNRYYILFTAASIYEAKDSFDASDISTSKRAPFRIRIGVATTKDFKKITHATHLFPGLDTKDAALFPAKIHQHFYVLHRVHPDLSLARSKHFIHWQHTTIAYPRPGMWDSNKIGAGAPPILRPYGWLLFYHGVDDTKTYHIGIMVLDKSDLTKVIYRSAKPILSPKTRFERVGWVDRVVFVCGATEWREYFYLYYGAADRVVGLAMVQKNDLDKFILKSIQK